MILYRRVGSTENTLPLTDFFTADTLRTHLYFELWFLTFILSDNAYTYSHSFCPQMGVRVFCSVCCCAQNFENHHQKPWYTALFVGLWCFPLCLGIVICCLHWIIKPLFFFIRVFSFVFGNSHLLSVLGY